MNIKPLGKPLTVQVLNFQQSVSTPVTETSLVTPLEFPQWDETESEASNDALAFFKHKVIVVDVD